jgi:TrmH family RNA methyltransferase
MPEEMIEITSRENQQLKIARRVRDRKVTSLVFIEGVRLVTDALNSGQAFESIFVERAFAQGVRGSEMLEAIRVSCPIHLISEALFRSIADTDSPQGLAAIVKRPATGVAALAENLARADGSIRIVVMLVGVNNPSNLGAVIRTAEAAGASGLITTRGSTDAFAAKSLRSSMGSAFRLPIWEGVEFKEALDWAGEHGLSASAFDVKGTASIYEKDWKGPQLLIFGSEAAGLCDVELAQVETVLTVPMSSAVESLNLAVTAGIVLFEARRALTTA